MKIEIFGYADQMVCAGCDSHEGEGAGCASCQPGAKRGTRELVEEFSRLLESTEYRGVASVAFAEADETIKERAPEVYRLLSMADLAPAIAVDGKVLYLGGFSPLGLLEELRKRYPSPN